MAAPTVRRVKPALPYVPAGTMIVDIEHMSHAFTKYHLSDGRALHRFRSGEPHADPHDHPWLFETEILDGGYVEEVFHIDPAGGWRSELVHRAPYTAHQVEAPHIHRIVELPQRDCWTLIRAGRHEREVCFWRFGNHGVKSRAWHERRWRPLLAVRHRHIMP